MDVLYGGVNPSGRLPESFPKRLEDNPSYLYYFGEAGTVNYSEGLFVGYRYYESKKQDVLFPFGYGLSYTTFQYSDLRLDKEKMGEDEALTVSVTVTNTGKRHGKTVVQLYVAPEKVEMIRPARELKAFDKVAGPDFCVNDYVCWSAPLDDLGDWRYEGVIYKASQDARNTKGDMHMCAPDVVRGSDGRYYLYYEFHRLTVTSVAVCGTPAGKYEFYGYIQRPNGVPYGEKKGEVNLFDPGVLVDDDGRVYMYTGFAPPPGWMKIAMGMRGLKIDAGYCVELEQDMITMKGDPKMVLPGPSITAGTGFEEHGFFEASSIRKIDDTYYLVWQSGTAIWNPSRSTPPRSRISRRSCWWRRQADRVP